MANHEGEQFSTPPAHLRTYAGADAPKPAPSAYQSVALKWAHAMERMQGATERCAQARLELEEAQKAENNAYSEFIEVAGRGAPRSARG